MNSLQDEFDNAGHSAQCTVAVHVHRIPYFIFNNPQNTPPIPFSRKLRGAKQNEKGMHVGQLFYEDAVLQYTVCLSLLLVYGLPLPSAPVIFPSCLPTSLHLFFFSSFFLDLQPT